jgi:hypothetical protein
MAKNWKFVCTSALSVLCFNPLLMPCAASFGVSTAMAAHAYAPGESQPVADVNLGTWAIYPVGVGQVLAQTFTPDSNEWLGYLQLPVGCSADVLLNVKIREGLGGTVLYEVNIAGLPTSVSNTLQLIQVYDPDESKKGIKLRKGREYAFELAAFPRPGASGLTCGIAKGPASNSYAGGRGYFQDSRNGTTFLPLPNGAATDDEDLPFITLVR